MQTAIVARMTVPSIIGGGTRGAMGATAPLNIHLKGLSPPMWGDKVLLVASA